MKSRHWHMASWIEGSGPRGTRLSSETYEEGSHYPLIDLWGAYAFAVNVKGAPTGWVCHWVCDVTHRS